MLLIYPSLGEAEKGAGQHASDTPDLLYRTSRQSLPNLIEPRTRLLWSGLFSYLLNTKEANKSCLILEGLKVRRIFRASVAARDHHLKETQKYNLIPPLNDNS